MALPRVFTIDCTGNADEARAAIRAGLSKWLAEKDGPRGWVAGPFMCLWRTALLNDNTVYALILRRGWQARIVGVTLDDIALALALLLPVGLLGWLIPWTIAGQLFALGTVLLGILAVGAIALVIHWPRGTREDRTIVFLRRAAGGLTMEPGSEEPLPDYSRTPRQAKLTIGSNGPVEGPTAANIRSAFSEMDAGVAEYLILESGAEHFVQCRPEDHGYVVEWRDGGAERHFVARRPNELAEPLSSSDALRLILDYLHESEWPDTVSWEKRWLWK